MQRAYRFPSGTLSIAVIVRLLTRSGRPAVLNQEPMDYLTITLIRQRVSVYDWSTGKHDQDAGSQKGDRHGCPIGCIEGGTFNRRSVPARRILRAVVHCIPYHARALPAGSR